jgi:hypothetical protein
MLLQHWEQLHFTFWYLQLWKQLQFSVWNATMRTVAVQNCICNNANSLVPKLTCGLQHWRQFQFSIWYLSLYSQIDNTNRVCNNEDNCSLHSLFSACLKPHCILCSHFKVDDVSALEASSKPPVRIVEDNVTASSLEQDRQCKCTTPQEYYPF